VPGGLSCIGLEPMVGVEGVLCDRTLPCLDGAGLAIFEMGIAASIVLCLLLAADAEDWLRCVSEHL
jgi:hypothetical protein